MEPKKGQPGKFDLDAFVDRDLKWIERNHADLLDFARSNYALHGRGAVVLGIPLANDYAASLGAGRVRYFPATDMPSPEGNLYAAVNAYDPALEAAIIATAASAADDPVIEAVIVVVGARAIVRVRTPTDSNRGRLLHFSREHLGK